MRNNMHVFGICYLLLRLDINKSVPKLETLVRLEGNEARIQTVQAISETMEGRAKMAARKHYINYRK